MKRVINHENIWFQAPTIKFMIPSGPNNVEDVVREEMSLEESVLNELELVMAQVSESLNCRITMHDANCTDLIMCI